MDACYNPTGVTRHALAQTARLRRRPDVELRLISGRIAHPDGLTFWESMDDIPRRELPLSMRTMLRLWRMTQFPPIDLWAGGADWIYCPAEYWIPTIRRKLAVTSHDVLQDLTYGSDRRKAMLGQVFGSATLILSVSEFNTRTLVEAFPACKAKVRHVPNAAEDLFFEPADPAERSRVRADLGLPDGVPYLLSVASFQPRKNLARLVRAAGRLREVAAGDLAVVLVGDGSAEEIGAIREAVSVVGPGALVRTPGYLQGRTLRAAYAEASALVFPSTCESFGIPAIEAMAQGCPVALADSTALPEIGGEAGWYFDPSNDESIAETLKEMLGQHDERGRRADLGRTIASRYRWDASNDRLVAALRGG
jgi:glycosyltransferase involved in cell wall biosynthesis